jgi:predicted DNA-binding transcriptional regulator AlpA
VNDDYFTIEGLAVWYGLSRSATYSAIKRGELPEASHKRGARLLWSKAEVEKWLSKGPQRRVLTGSNVSVPA